jgi:hypothetical protein
MSTDQFIVFSSAVPGAEEDYAAWYARQHIHDILRLPGVTDGQFFAARPGGRGVRWTHLALYGVNDGETALAELARRRGTPDLPSTDSLDRAKTTFLLGTAKGPPARAAETTDSAHEAAAFRLVTLTNPLEGREAEYDEHYEGELGLLLEVPGLLSVQRFLLRGRDAPSEWRFATVYAIDGRDPAEVLAEAGRRSCNPASERGGRVVGLYGAQTPRLRTQGAGRPDQM